MQTITKRYQGEGLPGQMAEHEHKGESLATGYIGQNSRNTIGDAAYVATTYYITVPVTDGISVVFEYDGTADANATAAATGMAAAWNNDPAARQLGEASVAVAKNVDIAWTDYTRSWSPVLTTADAATFTHAVQRAASSTIARMGVLVARGASTGNPRDARPLAVLTSASVVGDIRGAVIREDLGVEQTSLESTADSYDAYPAGRAVPICGIGKIWVPCETAMAVDGPIFVRKSGTGIIGALRNDADGGAAIDFSSKAAVVSAGAAGKTCKIKIHIPL